MCSFRVSVWAPSVWTAVPWTLRMYSGRNFGIGNKSRPLLLLIAFSWSHIHRVRRSVSSSVYTASSNNLQTNKLRYPLPRQPWNSLILIHHHASSLVGYTQYSLCCYPSSSSVSHSSSYYYYTRRIRKSSVKILGVQAESRTEHLAYAT
jgi:hypothetical protein